MNGTLKHPLIGIPIRYALVGIFLYGALFLLLYYTGHNPLVAGRPWDFGFLLIPVMIFFSLKDFKTNYNQGELRFWQGMTCGFITYLVIAVGTALFIYLFLTFADPAVLDGYIDDRIQLIESSKAQFVDQLGEELYHEQLAKMSQTSAWVVALDDFWKKVAIGLFLTILIAAVMRK
ncbi:MAG: hypothetical protein DHS20C17_26170 [Cyclobacteriaceae bacterium]|nr:MAG: hypothetical protein DHS20C17_26170 [Cyclobacteriaceae bacterium]